MVVPGAVHFLHLLHLQVGFGRDRSLQLGRSPTSFVFLLICVWARHGCRALNLESGAGHCELDCGGLSLP